MLKNSFSNAVRSGRTCEEKNSESENEPKCKADFSSVCIANVGILGKFHSHFSVPLNFMHIQVVILAKF